MINPVMYDLMTLAVIAHDGQVRKGSGLPYVTHPIAVAQILRQFDHNSVRAQGAALCHDILEDCDESFGEELEDLEPRVHELVQWLTNCDTFIETCEQLRNAPYIAQIVKCADIIHNTSDSVMSTSYKKKKLIQLTYLDKVRNEMIWQFAVKQIQDAL